MCPSLERILSLPKVAPGNVCQLSSTKAMTCSMVKINLRNISTFLKTMDPSVSTIVITMPQVSIMLMIPKLGQETESAHFSFEPQTLSPNGHFTVPFQTEDSRGTMLQDKKRVREEKICVAPESCSALPKELFQESSLQAWRKIHAG